MRFLLGLCLAAGYAAGITRPTRLFIFQFSTNKKLDMGWLRKVGISEVPLNQKGGAPDESSFQMSAAAFSISM
ncbi:MAG: hypothetical protein RL497_1377 [Pseudomonadota bacterium]